MQHRPDLLAISEKLRAANAELKVAQADYRPSFHLQASAAQQKIWPSADYGVLGNANQTVWSVGMRFQWSLFDGGLRKNEVRLANSKRREAQDEMREKQDAIGREVWTAYLQFRTAVRPREAAETLFTSASTSYDASLDAYKIRCQEFSGFGNCGNATRAGQDCGSTVSLCDTSESRIRDGKSVAEAAACGPTRGGQSLECEERLCLNTELIG